MLPMLNLQLPSLELLETTPEDPGLLPLEGGALPEAGFAETLRLRVDLALSQTAAGGEILPPAGTTLPPGPEIPATELSGAAVREITGDSLPVAEIDPQLLAGVASEVGGGEPGIADIELQLPLDYPGTETADRHVAPLSQDKPTLAPAAPVVPVATATELRAPSPQTAAPAAPPIPGVDAKPQPPVTTAVGGDPAQVRLPETPHVAAERVETRVPEANTRPRVQVPVPRTVVAAPETTPDELRPLTELPRRSELAPAQNAPVGGNEVSDVIKARPAVIQTIQVLNAQANPQQVQPLFTPAAPSVSAEPGYSAVAQQVSDAISVPVRDSAWGEQIGQRVLLMAGNQARTAEIRLTPAELGPLRVQVEIDDGAAHVTFQAQHATTREAIEQALPRLRELFAENGLSLGQANVGEQGVSERNRGQLADGTHVSQERDDAPDTQEEPGLERESAMVSNSLVDTFA